MEINNQIEIYLANDGSTQINVQFGNDTVWLTQDQMATLFGKGRSTITEHILNVYSEQELEQKATSRKYRQVRKEGNRNALEQQ